MSEPVVFTSREQFQEMLADFSTACMRGYMPSLSEAKKRAAHSERVKLWNQLATAEFQFRSPAALDVAEFGTPQPYVPAVDTVDSDAWVLGQRLPWLEEDNTISLGLLMYYAGHAVLHPLHVHALDQVRDIKARWAEATGPDANGDPKDPKHYFELHAGRTSIADIKRIVEWQA